MSGFNGFSQYVKKFFLIVFVLFLNSLLGDCSGEDDITIISIYTVDFDSQQSGLSVESQHVTRGLKAAKPADLIREGFQFLSWVNSTGDEYDFDSPVTNNLTLYAKWDVMTTVTFNSVGGSPVESQVYIGMSNAVRPPDPTRNDYDFLAWTNSAGEEYDFDTVVTEDIVLGAKWIRLYTVTFDPRDGSPVIPQTVREGSNVIKPSDPVRAGYSFSNWTYLGGSVYNFTNTPVTDHLSLYGLWAIVPGSNYFSLTINYNDKATLDSVIPVIDGETFSAQYLPDPEHPDSAYDFYGWYTTAAAEEGDEYDEDTPITNDVTVYAKWLTDDLEKIVYLKEIPADLSGYDQLTRNVLSLYEAGAEVEARYVDAQEQGTGSGDKWANASDDLKQLVDDITDASESKVYLVLVTGETYAPSTTMGMENHVAIIGGYHSDGSWERPSGARTVFDGNYQRRLFYAAGAEGIGRTALLYDVEIYRGNEGSGSGHGMRLDTASPTLWKVVFNNNNNAKDGSGGGLTVTEFSYPILIDVKFTNNQADSGSGLFVKDSSVILSNVEFNNNKSEKNLNNDGRGAMLVRLYVAHGSLDRYPDMILDGVTFSFNEGSQGGGLAIVNNNDLDNDILPITVRSVEFEGNTATDRGGGLYVKQASIFFENVTFDNNSTGARGGAINNDSGSLIFVNTTFYNNQAKYGSVIRMENSQGNSGEAPHLKFINVTAVDNNTTDTSSGDLHIAANYEGTDGGSTQLVNSLFWDENFDDKGVMIKFFVSGNRASSHHKFDLIHSVLEDSTEVTIEGGDQYVDKNEIGMMTVNPIFDSLQDNGGMVKTMSINAQEMKDAGVYVKGIITDGLFYYSEDDKVWYRMDDLNDPTPVILLVGTEELNYTDARGFDRVGRPDLGAYEAQP